MRDQMDAEIWNANHDQFSEWLDERVVRAAKALRTHGRVPVQLFAAVAAVSLAGLTLGSAIA